MACFSDARWTAPNDSNDTCNGVLDRPSCCLDPASLGRFDAISAIRMVISSLSILGTVSIIVSAIAKRQVWSPKVLPIFVLSVADFFLAWLWMVGGTLWLRRAPDRDWCIAVSVLTIILECVTTNLTLVYAVLAYASIKKTDFNNILLSLDKSMTEQVWPWLKSFIVYFLAWAFPIVIVMIQFGVVAGTTDIVQDAAKCSCWCRPVFGNVLPYAVKRDIPTAEFIHDIRKLVASNGVVVGAHYLIVFILLVVIYYKILQHIKKMQLSIAGQTNDSTYGATQALLARGESLARRRIMYFLTVFIISGFFNLLLSIATMIYECVKIHEEYTYHSQYHHAGPLIGTLSDSKWYQLYYWLYYLQSVTIPIQGFLNAIVYGWTREDFLNIMAVTSKKDGTEVENNNYNEDQERETDNSGISSSVKEEHSFIRTLLIHTDVSDDDDM